MNSVKMRSSYGPSVLQIALASVWNIIGAAVVLIGFYLIAVGLATSNLDKVGAGVFCSLFFGFMLWLGIRPLLESAFKVALFEDHLEAKGTDIPYSEIHSTVIWASRSMLYGIVPMGSDWAYRIFYGNGQSLLVTNCIPHYQEFYSELEGIIFPRLYKGYASLMQSGSTVRFGSLDLSLEGVCLHGQRRVVPWSLIGGFHLVKGSLVVLARNGEEIEPLHVSIASIANLTVLLGIVRMLLENRTSPATTFPVNWAS